MEEVTRMQTPGLDHIIMTVSDIARAREFYGGMLSFELKDIPDGFYFGAGDVAFFFYAPHKSPPDDRFDEFRIGAGVATKGVEVYFTGHKYVAFRDPDNIQLEYWLPKSEG